MKYFHLLLNPIGAPEVNLEDEDMPRLINRPVLDPMALNEEKRLRLPSTLTVIINIREQMASNQLSSRMIHVLG